MDTLKEAYDAMKPLVMGLEVGEFRRVLNPLVARRKYRGKEQYVVGYVWTRKYSHHLSGMTYERVLGWGETWTAAIDKANHRVIYANAIRALKNATPQVPVNIEPGCQLSGSDDPAAVAPLSSRSAERRILDRCHHAVGESEHSDDESLPDLIETTIREHRQLVAELESARSFARLTGETPRTDAALDFEVGTPDSMAVLNLARQLERELAACSAKLDETVVMLQQEKARTG